MVKTRFSSLDIIAIVPELRAKICTGWRVNQIYDCDNKTYLFKLNKSIVKMKNDDDPLSVDEETANKMTLIVESGIRLHTSDFDWPKSHAPSSFATKLRKHLRNKRIEDIRQVNTDRLVDIQFGSNQAANHLIIELYDRGNLILTDNNYCILTILRYVKKSDKSQDNEAVVSEKTPDGENTTPFDSENLRVGQLYSFDRFKRPDDLGFDKIVELLNASETIMASSFKKRNKNQKKNSEFFELNLKDLLNPFVNIGGNLLEDKILSNVVVSGESIKKCFIRLPRIGLNHFDQASVKNYATMIHKALQEADSVVKDIMQKEKCPGYIIQKKRMAEPEPATNSHKSQKNSKESQSLITNIDFFPILSCAEHKIAQEGKDELTIVDYESFDKAVDVYFCNMESQKIDTLAFNAEKDARKKLENLKLAQEKRLDDLSRAQKDDEEKARLIELNSDKVENALLIIRSMIANQVSWADIWATIKQAQAMKDPIASLITSVKFDRNEFTMKLNDPYEASSSEEDDNVIKNSSKSNKQNRSKPKFRNVEIDISLSAYANARKFFDKRRTAVNKEKKTIEVSKKALKNVERRTKEMLKEVVIKTNITKARKRYWFENFFWFISTDGYLVVAGRDAEQNELLVKRYMKKNDIYVHADLHGASSVIIKNELAEPVPPKTLNEAGCMAVCYSSAWDSKIATTSWWVYPNQVSKTAPAGEYLTLGAFIIRGKKNYLPLSNLVLGFGFLFRLGEESIERRKQDRINHQLENIHESATANDDTSDEGQSLDSDTDSSEIGDHKGDSSTNNPTNVEHDDKPDIHNSNIEEVLDPDDEEVDNEDDDVEQKMAEYRLIDTLTDDPQPDDVLLYSIPMCGPYSAFQSFKYKVKVIPGTNKRGKAAKACLNLFLHDKKSTQREKDLLRVLKDQDYARNIPNKVKISSTNMKTITKKRPKKSEVRLPMSF